MERIIRIFLIDIRIYDFVKSKIKTYECDRTKSEIFSETKRKGEGTTDVRKITDKK